jgi:hypothetical protein
VKLENDLRVEVDSLGQVAHLVSPNKLHHLYLAHWKAGHPAAKLWRLPSNDSRRWRSPGALGDAPHAEWDSDIDQAWFRGSFMMDEVVFFHRPSRTAIFVDLIEAFSGLWNRRPRAP